MLLFRLVCDGCGAKTNEFSREIELIIHSEKEGWSHERPDDPAVMGLDYCPKCNLYHDLQYHGPYESDETAVLEHTDTVIRCHHPSQCEGQICSLHNRTDHSMRSFPQHWRSDRGIMERTCPHGVSHPDPDEYRILNGDDDGTHGCDGCCAQW